MKNIEIIAYTDGSYERINKIFTYGCYIYDINKTFEKKFNGKFKDKLLAKSHNVAGEIMGVVKSINYAIENNFKSILINHDYIGLSKWINDEWKTKNLLTKKYKEFIDESSKKIKIYFNHVKSHSGILGNEIADKLASNAYNNNTFEKPFLIVGIIDILTKNFFDDDLIKILEKNNIKNGFKIFKESNGNYNLSIFLKKEKYIINFVKYDVDKYQVSSKENYKNQKIIKIIDNIRNFYK